MVVHRSTSFIARIDFFLIFVASSYAHDSEVVLPDMSETHPSSATEVSPMSVPLDYPVPPFADIPPVEEPESWNPALRQPVYEQTRQYDDENNTSYWPSHPDARVEIPEKPEGDGEGVHSEGIDRSVLRPAAPTLLPSEGDYGVEIAEGPHTTKPVQPIDYDRNDMSPEKVSLPATNAPKPGCSLSEKKEYICPPGMVIDCTRDWSSPDITYRLVCKPEDPTPATSTKLPIEFTSEKPTMAMPGEEPTAIQTVKTKTTRSEEEIASQMVVTRTTRNEEPTASQTVATKTTRGEEPSARQTLVTTTTRTEEQTASQTSVIETTRREEPTSSQTVVTTTARGEKPTASQTLVTKTTRHEEPTSGQTVVTTIARGEEQTTSQTVMTPQAASTIKQNKPERTSSTRSNASPSSSRQPRVVQTTSQSVLTKQKQTQAARSSSAKPTSVVKTQGGKLPAIKVDAVGRSKCCGWECLLRAIVINTCRDTCKNTAGLIQHFTTLLIQTAILKKGACANDPKLCVATAAYLSKACRMSVKGHAFTNAPVRLRRMAEESKATQDIFRSLIAFHDKQQRDKQQLLFHPQGGSLNTGQNLNRRLGKVERRERSRRATSTLYNYFYEDMQTKCCKSQNGCTAVGMRRYC